MGKDRDTAPGSGGDSEAGSGTGYTPADREYRRIQLALFIAAFVAFAQLYELQVLLPEVSATFGIGPATASLSMSLATGALAVALFFVGPSSERLGRRPIIIISLIATSLIGVVLGFAPVWHVLLVGRLLQGLALAGLPAVATAYLAEEIRPEHLPRAAGVYVAGTALGGMFGRMLAGALVQGLGWHGTITAIGVLGVILSLLVWRLLPKQNNFHQAAPGLQTLISNTKAVLTEPGMLLLFVVAGTSLGAYQAVFNMIPYRLTAVPYLLPIWLMSLIFLVNFFGAFAARQAGVLASKHGRRAVVPLGALLYLVGVALTMFTPLPLVILGVIVLTIGFFVVHSVAAGWVTARAVSGVGAAGQAASAYSISYYAGGSVFGTLAGLGWQYYGWWGVAGLAGGLIVVVIAASLILRRIPPLSASGY